YCGSAGNYAGAAHRARVGRRRRDFLRHTLAARPHGRWARRLGHWNGAGPRRWLTHASLRRAPRDVAVRVQQLHEWGPGAVDANVHAGMLVRVEDVYRIDVPDSSAG